MTTCSTFDNVFTHDTGIQVSIIGGAMYPCSNSELVAAVSEAGGIGVVQMIGQLTTDRRTLRERMVTLDQCVMCARSSDSKTPGVNRVRAVVYLVCPISVED